MELYNQQIEREVLGAMLLDDNICAADFDKLDKDMFVDGLSRKVYDIMVGIIKEGRTPLYAEVIMQIEVAEGYTADIPLQFLSFSAVEMRIDILQDLKVRRNLNRLCLEGIRLTNDMSADISEVQKLIGDMSVVEQEKKVLSFGDVVVELQNDVANRMKGEDRESLLTGLHIFDSRHGFHAGDLVIVAGETSQGKSTLATTLARNMGLYGYPSAYYSLEMDAKKLTARIVAHDVMIASSRLLYGKVTDKEFTRFYDVTAGMVNLPIYFDDESRTSFNRICSSIKKMVKKYNVKVVFIDYLQILANGTDNRESVIGDMARDLKRLAVDEGICIIALSQLSRNKEQKKPTLSRLRGSGQIEEACDVAVLIYRPEVFGIKMYENGVKTKGTAQLIIAKGRNIGIGDEIVTFNSGMSFFSDYIGEQPEEQKESDMPW